MAVVAKNRRRRRRMKKKKKREWFLLFLWIGLCQIGVSLRQAFPTHGFQHKQPAAQHAQQPVPLQLRRTTS